MALLKCTIFFLVEMKKKQTFKSLWNFPVLIPVARDQKYHSIIWSELGVSAKRPIKKSFNKQRKVLVKKYEKMTAKSVMK